jgi:hypothetical protein
MSDETPWTVRPGCVWAAVLVGTALVLAGFEWAYRWLGGQ